MRRVFYVTILLIFGAPPTALAGSVSLRMVATDPKYGYESPVLAFSAAPGEANRITVADVGTAGTPVLELHDGGAALHLVAAPMQAGPASAQHGCSAVDGRTVRCPVFYAFVDAGDGDDTVTLQRKPGPNGYGAYVRGGEGADVLSGQGFLAGGLGNDVLTCPEPCAFSRLGGGPGDDVLRGVQA